MPPELYVLATRYEVCALPPNYRAWRYFVVTVKYRGDDRWAVCRHGMCHDADGHRDYEASPSNRDEQFIARYRFPLDQALDIARALAPTLTVNRFTVADALKNGPEWV